MARSRFGVGLAVVFGSLACSAAAWGQAIILQGTDRYATQTGTQVQFGGEIPVLPADFFGPGSLPFGGLVPLAGLPSISAPDNADTIVQRLTPSTTAIGGTTTIPIQLVQLSLQSVAPIHVHYGSGPDQLWDVHVDLNPGPPMPGQQSVTRDDIMSGTYSLQMQWTPRFTFTNQVGGDTRVFVPSPLVVTLLDPAVRPHWGQVPFAASSTNTMPNLFPRSVFTLHTAGGALIHVLGPSRSPDCNQNGIADAVEISNDPNLDVNRNGIVDTCEINIGLTQISIPDDVNGGFAQRFSNSGQLAIEYVPRFFDVFWGQATLQGQPSMQNAPLLDINLQGQPHRVHVPVALPQSLPSTQILSLPVNIVLANDPQATIPVAPVTFIIPVFEHVLLAGMDDPPPVLVPQFRPFAEGIIDPAIPGITWMSVSRRNVGTVNEPKNHCAPGAVARSLFWLSKLLCSHLPATNDEAQEMHDKLKNMDHLMTTRAGGTNRGKYVPGIQKFLDDKMLKDCLKVEKIDDSDPGKMFADLQRGCDVVGLISWYDEDGNRTGGHAITVSGAIKCGDEVTIDFNDDAHGTDKQDDDKADSGDTKKAGIGERAGGGKRLKGYGLNSWDGYVRICPARKCQVDALNKWVNGDPAAPGGAVEGIEALVNRLLSGAMPTEAEKKALRQWAENAHDAACFLVKNLEGCNSPELDEAKMAAANLKLWLGIVAVRCIIYSYDCNLAELGIVPDLLGAAFDDAVTKVREGVDCNGNGVDDLTDIANGSETDINMDCIPDSCQCLGDFDHSGFVDADDLFAFLDAWFAQNGTPLPLSSDMNGSGGVDADDLFAFLDIWFASNGTPCP